ncbi:MAG TPA: magnesium transporter, partial [Devosia sp.]|nr:magnesium transporter [Devosia sp.]
MTNEPDFADGAENRPDPNVLRDAEDHLNDAWLERLRTHLHAGDAADVIDIMEPLHAADAGDVLEALDAEERNELVRLLGDRFDFSALTEVDDAIRTDIVESMPSEHVARGVSTLDTDDAVHILED